MKRFFMIATLMLLSTVIFAQVDSTFVQQIGHFVNTLFGAKASENVMAIVFKAIGILAALDWLIVIVITLIPTTSPARSFVEKLLTWIRGVIGDKKSGGGTFSK